MIWPWQKQQGPHEARLPGNDDAVLDTDSPTWKYVEARMEEELDKLRRMNDNKKHDATETAHIRGRIWAIKVVLNMGKSDQ